MTTEIKTRRVQQTRIDQLSIETHAFDVLEQPDYVGVLAIVIFDAFQMGMVRQEVMRHFMHTEDDTITLFKRTDEARVSARFHEEYVKLIRPEVGRLTALALLKLIGR